MKNITFINAGAGSGKTYRLTTDLARMLTQEGLDPSQVILTTYTELAAAEFREKARKEILAAKDQNGNSVNADLRIKSATQLDNAFIGTVHAISFRFIRKYWYLLEFGADIQTMSDQNQDFYMSQSISDIVTESDRKVFRELRETFDIKDAKNKPYPLFWLPELKEIVDKMEYYDIESVEESVEKSMETTEAIFNGMSLSTAFECINVYLPKLWKRCEGLLPFNKYADKARRWMAAIENVKSAVNSLSDLKDEGIKECLEDTVGEIKDDIYSSSEYKNAIDAYQQTFISRDLLPVVKSYIKTIFNLAVRWQKALQAYKQENHIISFNDMEKIFLAILTEPKYKEVQDDIANNFKLLMVDEFQDSNPIQLKIFNRISELIAKNGGHSIWVGDPKQTIYGFRGSDSRFISEILSKFEFSDDGSAIPEQGPDMLGTDQLLQSWRSRPALVDFSNRIFLEPFKNGGLKEKQITLKAHYTADTDTMGSEQALYVWRTEQEKSSARARMLARQIKVLLESKRKVHHHECDKPTNEITYRDIAVLCYRNDECKNVASELRKLGLPASCEETNLMQCQEVYLLKTILLFMQNPSDKLLRAELAMMLCDATTEEILIDRINYVNTNQPHDEEEKSNKKEWDDKWLDPDMENKYAETIAKLKDFASRYQNLSVYDIVVAILEELDLENVVVKWGDATQRKHNLSTVVNMAKAYDDMCLQMGIGSSIFAFINYLTITKPENKTDNSANTIKVLTYHSSKGLEWPVVILYQLWREFCVDKELAKKKFRGTNVCECDNQDTNIFERKHYICLFPFRIGGLCLGPNTHLPKMMEESITQLPLFSVIKKQEQEEALRLLYVGVTRAKDILVSLTSKNGDGNAICKWPQSIRISEGNSDRPFGEGYNETLEELVESCFTEDCTQSMQYRMTDNVPGINEAPPLTLSPSTIDFFENAFTNNVMVAESEKRIIDMSMFAGEQSDAVKGSCIHDFFAVYKAEDNESNIKCVTNILTNYGFPNVLQMQKEKLIMSIDWLYKFLAKAYGPATRIERECPLLYSLPTGQILRGEIDLQWYYKSKDGQERCVLIDYKTFPGKHSEIEEHTKKYYAQLSAYHAVLTAVGVTVADTLIYYPVQAHVRKLTF